MADFYGLYTQNGISLPKSAEDCKYIAAANPIVIRELIAELRQARKERDWFLHFLDRVCPPPTLRDNDKCSNIDLNMTCNDCWLKAVKEAIK